LFTDTAVYSYANGAYALGVTLTPDGVVIFDDALSAISEGFISSEMLDESSTTITVENGFIIATSVADAEELEQMGDGIVSCVETYTLDAKTREVVSIKAVYTFDDGFVDETTYLISRDVEIPEGAKSYLAFLQEGLETHTVTIVSNPGTDNEKTDVIKVPKGLQVSLSTDGESADVFAVYSDAACTEQLLETFAVEGDVTVYVKWVDPREAMYEEAFALIGEKDYESAYALFVELGDYKDAAQQAAYFRYIPTYHYEYYTLLGEEVIVTYSVTLNEWNLPAVVVETYVSGEINTCTYTYNDFGKVTRRECVDEEGATILYVAEYDENGNLIAETVNNAFDEVSRFEYTYNELGQCVRCDVETENDWYYNYYAITYDEEGREIKIVYAYDDSNAIEEAVYDEEGRILKTVSYSDDSEERSENLHYYDENGRLIKVVFMFAGEELGYREISYDENGNMIKDRVCYDYGYDHTNEYEYDENGNAIKSTACVTGEEEKDYTLSEYAFVYIPRSFTEKEWDNVEESIFCYDPPHLW
jgi:ketosteroid isomerase-like protein